MNENLEESTFQNIVQPSTSTTVNSQHDLAPMTPMTMVRKYQVLFFFFFWRDKHLTRSFHINSSVSFFLLGQSPQKKLQLHPNKTYLAASR